MTCHDGLCKPAVLVDGTMSCTWSEDWRAECEARWFLDKLSPVLRQKYLSDVELKRGKLSRQWLEVRIDRLKSASRSRSAPTTRSTPVSTGQSRPSVPSSSAGQHGLDF